MNCPQCQTVNPEDSLSCKQCQTPLPDGEMMTMGGEGATLPSSEALDRTGLSFPSYPGGSLLELEAGAEFGPRYQIESLLGVGGMGWVYRAIDRELDRVVALKLVRPELTSNSTVMQRFKQELLLASKVSHKNILRIHDLGDVDGTKFISMAFVDGEDLHGLLKSRGSLSIEEVTEIGLQLCQALEAAHEQGVVHRDLKPHNVLVDRDSNVYVSDFGLAKSLESEATMMTRTGEVLGTPRYMSPEQVEGKPLDHRCDLYALGLILYEMVTGEVPFGGESPLQVMYQRVAENPVDIRQRCPELPEKLARIIMRCLQKDPEERYQGAREILEDLQSDRVPRHVSSRTGRLSRPALIAAASVLTILILVLALSPVGSRLVESVFQTAPVNQAEVQAQGAFVAVLPFRVLGDETKLGFVAEGLTEALSAKLFRSKGVEVASPSLFENAGDTESLLQRGRDLGVKHMLSGTLQAAQDRFRVIVNLDDIDGRRLWSEEFSGVTEDLLILEDQIFGQLVNALSLDSTEEELARASAHPTENIKAYDLYLRGRSAMRRRQEIANVEEAISLYELALEKDSGFALAYAGLAEASLEMYRHRKETFWTEKAANAARQGQRLNPELPEVHLALGEVYLQTGKVAESVLELERALELAPNSEQAHRLLGSAYFMAGRREEAVTSYQRAIQINPYDWFSFNSLGAAHLRMGNYSDALGAFERVTELEPENAAGFENMGLAYLQLGQWEECIPVFEKAIEIQPYYSTYSNLGTAYFYLKRYDQAVEMFEQAVQMNPNEQIAVGNLADAYRWSGKMDRAIVNYDKAISLAYKELRVNPRQAVTMGYLALYYAKKGEIDQALEFIRRARSIDEENLSLIYQEGVIHSLAGQQNESLGLLRKAFQNGYPVDEARTDPELDALKKRPEFERLLKEFGHEAS